LNIISKFKCDIKGLDDFAKQLAIKNNLGDIYLLRGDLGVGKTTFSRSLINHMHDINKLERPINIKSPSFPIMINYPLVDYEINHYDLYRLADASDLIEINFYENLEKNISIIEWPEIILKDFKLYNYFLIDFNIIDQNNRFVKLQHTKKFFL